MKLKSSAGLRKIQKSTHKLLCWALPWKQAKTSTQNCRRSMLHEMTMHDIVELQDTYIEYKEFIGAGATVILHSYDCKTQCVIFTPIKTLYQVYIPLQVTTTLPQVETGKICTIIMLCCNPPLRTSKNCCLIRRCCYATSLYVSEINFNKMVFEVRMRTQYVHTYTGRSDGREMALRQLAVLTVVSLLLRSGGSKLLSIKVHSWFAIGKC